ncbi:serine/threonine protein kinase [Nocardia puris]|uniref:serine/threonine-protein kinase n=1 Tax=Nocardia puris TaxID=208602 RepID=UPI0018938006|nr:serine/threonine-protein kinase [Nocardia puris]MBF6210092.1 serine/threonine protein kinase [Nocardia puris]MBF6368283.1 serine/threonine protein kinase [Nocardia puris]MBF6457998.1 serine/threonine protein kinase [Nocardia puris]
MDAEIDPWAHEPDRAKATRTALREVVAEFDSAWRRSGEPPDLAAHVPPTTTPYRRTALIELIKVDLHHRWLRHKGRKRLADYRRQFPELDSAPLPPDLVYEEISVRSSTDDEVDLGEYTADYPAQMTRIGATLGDEQFHTTMLSDPESAHALDALETGTSLDDFDLLLPLGQGSFARVFLARQRTMQRLVAVKVSRDRGREPQTLAQLDHEHIVRVFDQRSVHDRSLRLLYMQYVPGGTLLGVLRHLRTTAPGPRGGQTLLDAVDKAVTEGGVLEPQPSETRRQLAGLSWPETVAWLGSRLATALDYANRRGVLHRDIKPANVLLTADGHPKLADFNISFSRHIPGASPAAYFGGSLPYMSPEQLAACHPTETRSAADLDTRSDLYALAVVLWELLTGRLPFDDEGDTGDSDASLARMIERRSKPVDPTLPVPPDCPPVLRQALLTSLSPDPDDRYPSGAELAHQLELSLDRTARDLVAPPARSLRARLRMRPMPVVTLSSALGQLLGVLYLSAHNTTLLERELTPEAMSGLTRLAVLVGFLAYPIGIGLLLYWCRAVFLVPEGLRHGKKYDEGTLARARADTLVCGDRIAVVAFAGWTLALLIFLVQLTTEADLSPGLLTNLIASHLVAAAVAVVYTYFPVTFFVLRWYYPGLLAAGHPAADESARLRRLSGRARIYLGIAASVPLFGVAAGLAFLDSDQQRAVIGSIVALCVGGLFAFLVAMRVYYILESDLRALDRVVRHA